MANDNIAKVFARRRQSYYRQNLKYLRYVFNDHFMLFLLIILATLAVQYAQFLQYDSLNHLAKAAVFMLTSLLVLTIGRLSVFVEAPDALFLLPQENCVQVQLLRATRRSLMLPVLVSLLATLIASPALQLPIYSMIAWPISLIIIKYFLFLTKARSFLTNGLLDWESLIHYEEVRQTNLLKLFALFTNVKGIESHAKRRKYLDFLLPRKNRTAYDYLLWRSFLRSGDYWGMTVRLLLLVLLAITFIPNLISALLIATVINYLLIFQLLPLGQTQNYQLLLKVYPLPPKQLARAMSTIVKRILAIFVLLEFLAALLANRNLQTLFYSLAFVLLSSLIFRLYISYRLKTKK